MTKKKKQHLVPACYLKSFITDKSDRFTENENFESGLYVSHKALDSGWKMRGINHDIFTKSYYYNLSTDNVAKPVVEDFLSEIESCYKKHLDSILYKKEINTEALHFLSYFATLQYMRVEKFMDMINEILNKIGKWCYLVSSKESNNSNQTSDIVKKMLMQIDDACIPYENARVIFNRTQLPFITSDNPVVKKCVNIRDLESVIPSNLLNSKVSESIEYNLFFWPLTPQVAYMSCDLIVGGNQIELDEYNLRRVFNLNYWSLRNAHKYIYSSIEKPFISERELEIYLKELECITYMKIHSKEYRIIGEGTLVSDENSKITFLFSNPSDASNLQNIRDLECVEVFDKGKCVGGMRNCHINNFDSKSGLIEIESNFNFDLPLDAN